MTAKKGDDVEFNTVGELMDYLTTQPRNRQIVLQKDAEGNGYSPLAEASVGLYVADSTYSGEVHPTPEDVTQWVADGLGQEGDWYVPEEAERVVVLGPVN